MKGLSFEESANLTQTNPYGGLSVDQRHQATMAKDLALPEIKLLSLQIPQQHQNKTKQNKP